MLLIAVLVSPLLMFAATRVESRLGAAAGGWVTALPISFAIVVSLLGASQRQLAAGLAASSAAHLAAQVLFAVLTGALLLRGGVLLAGLVGLAGYLGSSLLLAQLPNLIAIGLGGLALLLAPRLFPPALPRQGETSRRPAGLIGLSAALVVGAAVLASQVAGPGIGGAVAAFPTVSGALCVAVSRPDVRQGIGVLSGFGSEPALLCDLRGHRGGRDASPGSWPHYRWRRSVAWLPHRSVGGCCRYPRSDSNRHWADFKSAASAIGLRGPAGTATGRSEPRPRQPEFRTRRPARSRAAASATAPSRPPRAGRTAQPSSRPAPAPCG